MQTITAKPEAYDLMHRGAIVLAEIESTGMRVNTELLTRQEKETEQSIRNCREELQNTDEYRLQRKRFGRNTKLTSPDQIKHVLFKELGFKPTHFTPKGNPSLTQKTLESIGTDFCVTYIRFQKLLKLQDTFLTGLRREVINGFLYPFFNLNIVRSYRSSSNAINFQNIPIRDKEISKIIRSCFIPRDGHEIIELDFKSLEVMVACCLSKDKKLTYDSVHGDMHRDMACEIFMLPPEEVTKDTRFTAKNDFVFAEFYGDFHKQIVPNLWNDIDRNNLHTASGVPLREHLKSKGITKQGRCDKSEQYTTRSNWLEHHVRKIEDRFWNERYVTYKECRDRWKQNYNRRGYFTLCTGFVCRGPVETRNAIINYPIQGPAFHCLLWCLTRLVVQMRQRKMKSVIVGQIHDSIVGDIHKKERDDYIKMALKIIMEDLPKHWEWITCQFEVEAEIAYNNWFEKEEFDLTPYLTA